MGRSRKPGLIRSPSPAGPAWSAFRARLFSWEGWGPAPDCFHCGHAIKPGLGTVQHLISPRARPDLAWERSNLRPAHAGGTRRCPECDLACQEIAAGNLAPRDGQGRPLPFPPEFLKAKIAERAAWKRRAGPSTRKRREARETPDLPEKIPPKSGRPRIDVNAGRAW